MAKNECCSAGGGNNATINESDLAYFGAALTSGEAAEASEWGLTALWDATADEDVVLARWDCFEQTVTGQDDGGNVAVAIGDPLYLHDATGVIDKAVNGGVFYGWAMAEVTSGSSTLICVWCGEDPDYTRFMDEQLLEFGDGAAGKSGAGDVLMWLDVENGHFYMQDGTAGSHMYTLTEDDATIRLNSKNALATSGDVIGYQSKPRAAASGTQTIYGSQISPGINDGIDAATIVGVQSDVIMKGTSGTLSGDIRAAQLQVTDENLAGRTVDGTVSLLYLWHQLAAHTFTGGIYAIRTIAAGGAQDYTAWALFPDDSGATADLASAIGNVNAVVHCVVGATETYLAGYDGYTPA